MIKYDAKERKESSGKSQIPLSGGVVMVEVLSPNDVEFDWAGTKITNSKKSNRKMLQVHTRVCKNQIGEGCWIIDYILLDSEYTSTRIGQMLDSLGFNADESRNLNPHDLCGLRGYVRVKHEEYEGETRARVDRWIGSADQQRMKLAGTGGKRSGEGVQEAEEVEGQESVPF
jgi:hypothetical protein